MDEETRRWFSENSKKCPECSHPIQKNEGCNHMTCRCGCHFCWLCLENFGVQGMNYNISAKDRHFRPEGYFGLCVNTTQGENRGDDTDSDGDY
jgi:hypothetical protein